MPDPTPIVAYGESGLFVPTVNQPFLGVLRNDGNTDKLSRSSRAVSVPPFEKNGVHTPR